MSKVPRVYIAIGSNLGDRADALLRAIKAAQCFLLDVRSSPIYETAPMYVEDQPPFLNGVISGETTMPPLSLLRKLKETEIRVGRIPAQRNGPREIDLDLVLYGDLRLVSIREDGTALLRIPHPRLAERRFVLQPLHDLDSAIQVPGLGPLDGLLNATNNQAEAVRKYSDALL